MVIRLACSQDYDKFYEGEIALRRELVFPPFCDIASVTVTSHDETELLKTTTELTKFLFEKLKGEYAGLPFVVYGPFEAGVYKVKEQYRMKLMIKCRLNSSTRSLFHNLLCAYASSKNVTVTVDLNPLNI